MSIFSSTNEVEKMNTANSTPPHVVKCLVKNVRHTRTLKIHQSTIAGKPVCGGGRNGKASLAWQEDIGPCNCRRCQQLIQRKAAGAPSTCSASNERNA